ncbi:DUF4373 domain-containing protein [Clostridium sp. UBA871]|uniref:DUF4373 domain-containing protein n=1 Tax=Clostridium sp. UBA871 TaxID=1946380 RepID=UPI00321654DC
MARPQKEGLDYFPLDVDIDQDDKIALIESQYGIEGFAVIIKLMMKIYKTSYFYEWTEREQLLFSKRVNVDINRVNVIINDCVKWELFDETVLKDYQILTSKGIQRRYLEAVGRRQKVEMFKEYLLLDEKIIDAYKNLVIVNINPVSVTNMTTLIPKVKESKVKESRGEEKKENTHSLPPLSFPTPYHSKIHEQYGEITYRTWFIDTDIENKENEIVIPVKSEFIQGVINEKFKEQLEILLGGKIVVRLKE